MLKLYFILPKIQKNNLTAKLAAHTHRALWLHTLKLGDTMTFDYSLLLTVSLI